MIALFGLTYYIPKQQTSLSMIDRVDIFLKIAKQIMIRLANVIEEFIINIISVFTN